MNGIIGDLAPRDKAAIARAFGYWDTIEIWSPQLFAPALVNELREEMKTRVWPEPVNKFGHRLIVNRPSPEAIRILDRNWTLKHSQRAKGAWFSKWANLSLFRAHLAFDFDPLDGMSKDHVEHVIRNNIHLRYRRDDDEIYDHDHTQYSIKTKNRKSRPYQNTKFYPAEVSDLDGEIDKLHFELMLERKRSVQSAGLNRPSDLFNVNLADLFAKYCTVRDHTEHVDRLVKRAVKGMKPHPRYDVHEHARRLLLHRFRLENVSVFKQRHNRQFKRLQEWACFVIEPELQWPRQHEHET